MNPTHIEHLGIAVNKLEDVIPFYEKLLGTKCYSIEEVAEQKVKTAFFKIGQTKIELLEPTSEDSPIAKFIEKNGGKGGVHHVAFAVEGLQGQLDEAAEAAKVNQKPGDPKVINHYTADDNADGTPVYNDNDKVYQGTTAPPIYWNMRNDFTFFKNWKFSFSMYSYMGHKSQAGYYLNNDKIVGKNPLENFGENAAMHLKRHNTFKHMPDILVNSFYNPENEEICAFEELIGSHGGLGGSQTRPFILYPSNWEDPEELIGAKSIYNFLKKEIDELKNS